MRAALYVALATLWLGAGGCKRDPAAEHGHAPKAEPRAVGSAKPPEAAPPQPAALVGPGPSAKASIREREQTVLRLLSGEVQGHDFPLLATDPGRELDLGLSEKLAPQLKAQVVLGAIQVTGNYPQHEVELALLRYTSRWKRCYERQLAQAPSLSGVLSMDFTITQDGSVRSAALGPSTIQNVALQECVLGPVQRGQFAAPSSRSVAVHVPIFFLTQ